jgi:hypothetical protein
MRENIVHRSERKDPVEQVYVRCREIGLHLLIRPHDTGGGITDRGQKLIVMAPRISQSDKQRLVRSLPTVQEAPHLGVAW